MKFQVNLNFTTRFLLICDREGIRTPNPQSRNLIFYPVELRSQVLISLEKATINKIKIINDCQFRCQMITQSYPKVKFTKEKKVFISFYSMGRRYRIFNGQLFNINIYPIENASCIMRKRGIEQRISNCMIRMLLCLVAGKCVGFQGIYKG